MGKKYTDGGATFAPTAEIKVKGAMLKGIMRGSREVETKFGKKTIYTLQAIDADCKFTADGEEVTPAENAEVDIFPPTRLALQLAKVPAGETITIKYLGLGKNVKGNPPHLFSVEGE